jgi:beta-lactamase regulating signal transducer with metallopeptidase domain
VQVLVSMLLGNAAVAIALALIALVAMRLGRPAVAHVLWLLVIVKLLTPPLWRVEVIADDARLDAREAVIVIEAGTADGTTSPEFTHTTAATVAESPVTRVTPRQTPPAAHAVPVSPLFSPAPRVTTLCVPCLLAGVWTVGSFAWATITLIRIARFRRLLRASRPAAGDLSDEVAGVAARIGVRRVPELRLVDAAISPMLFFLGRRVQLVLPERLIEQMSRGQREGVIAHELAHLRRGDHWVRLLEMVATAILWWHPLLWLARRGLREAEEQCCDAWVVALLPDARRRYADALVDTLELVAARGLTLPAGATGLGRIAHLQRRLTMILTMNAPKSLSASGKLALALLALALLPMLPVRGQAKPPASPPGEASEHASSTAAPATRPAPVAHDDAYKAVEALLEAAAQDSDAGVQNAANAAIA